jgi:hypothetical protein
MLSIVSPAERLEGVVVPSSCTMLVMSSVATER